MAINGYHCLEEFVDEYHNNQNKPLMFDFKEASNKITNNGISKNNRQVHYIHYYPGRIYPYIPHYLLALNDFADLNGTILDPFAGSGTVLLESLINPYYRRNAFGVEINPLGRLISKVKTTPLDITKINEYMSEIEISYSNHLCQGEGIPNYNNLDYWFSEKAISKIALLKSAITNVDIANDYRDFFWVCFSNIIRKASKADPFIPPPVLLKPEKYTQNENRYLKFKKLKENSLNPDVWNDFKFIIEKNKEKVDCLDKYHEISKHNVKANIIWHDSRNIKIGKLGELGKIDETNAKKLPNNSIDLIITSPPYLTAQKYIRTSKLELMWLGYEPKEISKIDKSSIGTEKVPLKTDIIEFEIDSIDLLISDTIKKSKVRGAMVYSYFRNMQQALSEMFRVLVKGGYTILVVGNNMVLGNKINTYKLLVEEAINIGFDEKVILKDEIRTRSMITKRKESGGLIKNEYVIILKKED